jgi:hypothetical protein
MSDEEPIACSFRFAVPAPMPLCRNSDQTEPHRRQLDVVSCVSRGFPIFHRVAFRKSALAILESLGNLWNRRDPLVVFREPASGIHLQARFKFPAQSTVPVIGVDWPRARPRGEWPVIGADQSLDVNARRRFGAKLARGNAGKADLRAEPADSGAGGPYTGGTPGRCGAKRHNSSYFSPIRRLPYRFRPAKAAEWSARQL